MLTRNIPLKVKPICGLIYHDENIYLKTKNKLKNYLGAIDYESKIIPFDFTDYYNKEMGKPLFRRFLSFKNLRKSEEFPKIKLSCIRTEKRLSIKGKRTINIDPGYINLAKLVLFTTKDFSHRLHIKNGIYAEVTLQYRKKDFVSFEWTYPDYQTEVYKDIFREIRSIYVNQVNKKLT